jgi:hypothetical protein
VTPANANSGRRGYFREIVRGKLAMYTLVIGCIGGFVFGAYRGDPLTMVAAPVVVVAMVLGLAAFLADSRAARNFYLSFAETAGLEYVGDWEVLPCTPCSAPATGSVLRTG